MTHTSTLVHLFDESVDVLLPVAQVTALHKVQELARPESTGGVGKLERPQEVAGLLEVGANREDLMDQILHADDAVATEVLLDDGVVSEWDALLLRALGVSALVDKLTNGLEVRVAVGNKGFHDLEHLGGGFGQANEDTIVDLQEAEELEGLALLGVNLVDTLDPDDEGELRLGRDVVGAFSLSNTAEADLLTLSVAVLLDVRLGTFEDLLALRLGGLESMSVTFSSSG